MRAKAIAILILVSALTACDNEPAEGKPVATVSQPVAPSAEPAKPAEPGTQAAQPAVIAKYEFSNEGSKIEIVGAKVTGKHDGSFGKFTGTIELGDSNPEKSAVNVDIDLASVQMDDAKLTKHLKSPDFFDVAKFPKAKFKSTLVSAGGTGGTHTITGNFELHGVTKTLTFPATIRVLGDAVETDAEFAINRKDFNIVYPGMPDDLIKDDVLIKLMIRAKKAGSSS